MPTPPSKAPATRARAVKERQLALVEGASAELQAVGSRELQVDDDWEEKLNLNVKIMCVALDSLGGGDAVAADARAMRRQERRGDRGPQDAAGAQDHRAARAQRRV
jgi:hypothetical protein